MPPASSPVTPAPSPLRPPLTDVPDNHGNQGNIGTEFPELSVERNADGTLRVSVTDPTAKAWRIIVAGTADRSDDRLELEAQVGDVEPSVVVREIDGDAVIDQQDLTGLSGELTAAAGGCHRTLPVCWASADLSPPAADGPTFAVDLALLDPDVELAIQGASADWLGEPFLVGPWRVSDPFVTTAE